MRHAIAARRPRYGARLFVVTRPSAQRCALNSRARDPARCFRVRVSLATERRATLLLTRGFHWINERPLDR
jgi:hypothetical protein